MTVPNVLLLTGIPPGDGNVLQLLLRDPCRAYPRQHLSMFLLEHPRFQLGAEFKDLTVREARRPIGDAHLHPRLRALRYGGLATALRLVYARRVEDRQLLDQAVAFGRQQRVDLVWATLEYPTTIHLAKPLAEALGVPLVTTVWDPPEFQQSFVGRYALAKVLEDFEEAVRYSERCGVISENMRDEYQAQFATRTIVIRHGADRELWHKPATDFMSEDQFTIGFSGTLYASQEWQALIRALEQCNWRLGSKDVVLRVLTKRLHIEAQGSAHIEYFGWRTVEDAITLLASADVNYIPYWFDPAYRIATRLCFPTKLTTYLATGRPIFFHGPEGSSASRFLDDHPAGLACHTLEATDILNTLEQFMRDRTAYAEMSLQARDALEAEFDLRVSRRRFAELMEVSEQELLPDLDHAA